MFRFSDKELSPVLSSNQKDCLTHKHVWTIDKFAGFIKEGIEGAYIICQECGKVYLVEINKEKHS